MKKNKRKTGQKENKKKHADKNDDCHVTGINKCLLKNNKSRWSTESIQ